jgi:hypothetical protein
MHIQEERIMQYQDKFIGYVDILGFRDLVKASESGKDLPLPELMKFVAALGTKEDERKFEQYGPTTCPESKYISKNLNFRVTQISDCVIVSAEVSPAGIINLVNHCWRAAIGLLGHGIMCRGYITRGSIYHENGQVVGSGYQRAYEAESNVAVFRVEADERGTPFVEVDSEVCDFIKDETDPCVREMFSRYAKTQDGTTGLFPFQILSHSFLIGGRHKFNPRREKESNDNLRKLLHHLKEQILKYVDSTNSKAVCKSDHYLRALDAQLEICDKTDRAIDRLCKPV